MFYSYIEDNITKTEEMNSLILKGDIQYNKLQTVFCTTDNNYDEYAKHIKTNSLHFKLITPFGSLTFDTCSIYESNAMMYSIIIFVVVLIGVIIFVSLSFKK